MQYIYSGWVLYQVNVELLHYQQGKEATLWPSYYTPEHIPRDVNVYIFQKHVHSLFVIVKN